MHDRIKDFGSKLKWLRDLAANNELPEGFVRTKRKDSVQELHRASSVQKGTLSQLINGSHAHNIPQEAIRNIATLFGMSPDPEKTDYGAVWKDGNDDSLVFKAWQAFAGFPQDPTSELGESFDCFKSAYEEMLSSGDYTQSGSFRRAVEIAKEVSDELGFSTRVFSTPDSTAKVADKFDSLPVQLWTPRVRQEIHRPDVEEQLEESSKSSTITEVIGLPDTGKSNAVALHLQNMENCNPIWFRCHPGAQLDDVQQELENIYKSSVENDLVSHRLTQIIFEHELTLVLDDFHEADFDTFLPFLKLLDDLEGSSRLIIISQQNFTLKLENSSTVVIPPLTKEEFAGGVFSSVGVQITPTETHYSFWLLSAIRRQRARLKDRSNEVIRMVSSTSWQEETLNNLAARELKFVKCLSLLRTPLDTVSARYLAQLIELDELDVAIQSLIEQLVLQTNDLGRLELVPYIKSQLRNSLTADEILTLELLVGHALLDSWKQERKHVALAQRGIYHLQNGRSHPTSRRNAINSIRTRLYETGKQKQLIELYEREEHANPRFGNLWWYNQWAQCLISRLQSNSANLVLEKFQAGLFSKEYQDPNLLLALCVRYSELLTNVGEDDLATSILSVCLKFVDHSKLNQNGLSMANSTLAWSLLQQGATQEAGDILKGLQKHNDITGNPKGIAVTETRLGILYGMKNSEEACILALEKGVSTFRGTEIRGETYALSHLCYWASKLGRSEIVFANLLRLLDLLEEHSLFGNHSYQHLSEFLQLDLLDTVVERVDRLLSKLREIESNSSIGRGKIDAIQSLEAYLLERCDEPAKTKVASFGQKSYLLSGTTFPMRSELYKSMVASVAKPNDHEAALTKLFEQFGAERIFRVPLFSKLVTTCCKEDDNSHSLTMRFILPNLEFVNQSNDSTKCHFARFFEYIGWIDNAIELLGKVRNRNQFNYNNIMANCLRKASFESSMHHNREALIYARRPTQRSRIHTNMAFLILFHKRQSSFKEAENYCRLAIRERISNKFIWPEVAVLTLRLIRDVGDSSLEDTLANFETEFGVQKRIYDNLDEQYFVGRHRSLLNAVRARAQPA
ncbi:MAG: hypothetical protein ABJM29_10490 [Rhizobiaceae bacterium]